MAGEIERGSARSGRVGAHRAPIICLIALIMLVSGLWRASRLWPILSAAHAEANADSTPERGETALNLSTGEPLAREISGSQTDHYQTTLTSGQYLRVLLDKSDLHLSVTLYGPGDEKLAEFDQPRSGPIRISIITNDPGIYRLKVRSLEESKDAAPYKVSLEELRKATAQDRRRVEAERAFAAGEQLRQEWTADALRRATESYREAQSYWQSVANRREEARSLARIGDVYYLSSDYKMALGSYNRALALNRAAGNRPGEIEMLNSICYAYIYSGEDRKALGYCEQAYKLSQSINDRRGEAQALNNLGEAYYILSNTQKALELFTSSLSIWQNLGDRRGQALALINLGYSYYDLREMEKAPKNYEQSLAIWRVIGDRQGEALALTALGNFYSYQGERERALDFHRQAFSIFQVIGDRNGQAVTLNGIGSVYEHLGKPLDALDFYGRALELFHTIGNSEYESVTTILMGRVYHSLGDDRKAIRYYNRVLSIKDGVSYRLAKAYALNCIGMAYASLGQKQKALDYYRRAVQLYQELTDKMGEASTLNNIGNIQNTIGEKQLSLANYRQALSLFRGVEDQSGEAQTRLNIARAESDMGQLSEARSQIEASLEIIESLRMKVAGQQLRTSYFATVHQYYEFYIDLLMQMHKQQPADGFDGLALQASERARARSLLDSLTQASFDIRHEIDPVLLERESALKKSLSTKATLQMRLLSGPHTDEQAAALAKEIRGLTAEYEELEAQMRGKSQQYATLSNPQRLSLKEIQQQVPDDDTLFLEYALGDETSYLWAVTRNGLASYELPGRKEIEKTVQGFYDLLIARQAAASETFEEHQKRIREADEQYWQKAAALSRMVLGPVAGQLGKKRLVIIADGPLQYIPFAALTIPEPSGSDDARRTVSATTQADVPFLIEDHEIVYEQSVSALAMLRREALQRKPATRTVAVFADPVFGKDDSRVQAHTASGAEIAQRQSVPGELHEALRDAGLIDKGGELPPLPGSRDEAEAIISTAPPGDALKAVSFDASRANATDPKLSQYRIVHFATHAYLNNENPELSCLVLSLYDEQGRPQDGFLRLNDIYHLNLPIELVVLSACSTGRGKEIKGEGMIGLTRGFMYAGASSVMASLWKVDDAATAELMKGFYERTLKDGMPSAAALRHAQLSMLKQKRWRTPFYWAAFVLQGEHQRRLDPTSPGLAKSNVAANLLFVTLLLGLFAAAGHRYRVAYKKKQSNL